MRTPPLLADFSHARACKPFCENSLTLPKGLARIGAVECDYGGIRSAVDRMADNIKGAEA